ncbi:unnamed protein product [Adineta steineri]|uniref:Uncharacterized protein n=1 Tax=Adineta steineri TaxID=433720 RepID=A0A818WEB3_9BILA|nr:unnamed protein product [Adineta steineri]CAF1382484.1 unnamed protein product [Adineta steineri]CAF3723121.1 unnamed protein product [Adineta steineri]CAF4152579.1 unnamed protein product [Adineta steineri]
MLRIEIQNPTMDLYAELAAKYSIECDCSETSIPHKEFISLQPVYHQVCSSDFVTQCWIDYLFESTEHSFYFHVDFRSTAVQQFHLLAILYQLSIQETKDGLDSFLHTEIISDKLMSKDFLEAETDSRISTFKTNAPDAFDYKLMFIREMITGNALLTSTATLFQFAYHYDDDGHEPVWKINDATILFRQTDDCPCVCRQFLKCYSRAGFFGDSPVNSDYTFAYLYIIDGWYIGCRPIDSLLSSTLKTFYNQTMINSLLRFFNNTSSNFTCLDASKESIFDLNTNLSTIVQSGFIEKWIENINYSLYFNHCAPKLCSYTIRKRFNINYIITAIISVYGALSTILSLIIPSIVKLIIQHNGETSRRNYSLRRLKQLIITWLRQLIPALIEMNLFRSSTRVEPSDIYQQRWSTRFYITFLSIFFIIITIYTATTKQTNRTELIEPSFETVLDLQQQTYLSSLQCPCSKLSSLYNYSIKLTPTYHEICDSDFLSDEWIYEIQVPELFGDHNFRQTGPIFKLSQSFCKLAKITINNALNLFYARQLVTPNLITKDLFISQLNSEGEYFKHVTPNRFSYLLEFTRQTMKVNQFIYGINTNYAMSVGNDTGHVLVYIDPPKDWYDDNGITCSLIFDPVCVLQTILDITETYGNTIYVHIPGFYISVFYVNSVLLTQLQCLYNQSCVNIICDAIRSKRNFTALSQTSQFPNNVTIDFLSKHLFTETWSQNLSYMGYFEQCQPHSCSYTINHRRTFVLLMTTVIGLSSTVSIILWFTSPFIISFILKRCRQTQQTSSSENTQRGSNLFFEKNLLTCKARTQMNCDYIYRFNCKKSTKY